MISCDNYNRSFPKYPKLIEDKGWIYGVWYCGAFYKSKLYGDYPPTFLKRTMSLFPDVIPTRLLHCPSGSINGNCEGMTVDLIRDEKRQPKVVASADHLPFQDNSFDLVLSDPPYSKKDAKRYGTPNYPLKKSMAEFRRVLAPNGYLGLLHFYYPPFRRADWNMRGLIGVCTGSNRKMRMFVIFQSTKTEQQELL
jgi:SAM-dependent methyltransferase